MSLVVAKIAGNHACIVSETKLSSANFEDTRLKQHPADGVIKTVILNARQCVSFAGNEYYADKALREIENGGDIEDVEEILFRFHALSDYQTEFIFCFYNGMQHLTTFKNGQMSRAPFAWIGDYEAFSCYQRFYHGDFSSLAKKRLPASADDKTAPGMKNFVMTINSKVPDNDFSKMSGAMDNLLYHHNIKSVGGFRIQVIYDENKFFYNRYQAISNEVIDVSSERVGSIAFTDASKGSYHITCAKGGSNYLYAAVHVAEANLGVLYVRKKNGLLKPQLFNLDLLDFSDLISKYNLQIPIVDEQRVPKYYFRAKSFLKKSSILKPYIGFASHYPAVK